MRKSRHLAVIATMALALVACSGTPRNMGSSERHPASTGATATGGAAQCPDDNGPSFLKIGLGDDVTLDIAKLGEPVTGNGYTITVDSFQKSAKAPAGSGTMDPDHQYDPADPISSIKITAKAEGGAEYARFSGIAVAIHQRGSGDSMHTFLPLLDATWDEQTVSQDLGPKPGGDAKSGTVYFDMTPAPGDGARCGPMYVWLQLPYKSDDMDTSESNSSGSTLHYVQVTN